ncbi:MAG: hypothetical protein AMXMBFR61_25640 [Fimbriimonadales bacterium]
MITPYDWQQSIAQRAQYVEGRLQGGSPVVGLSCRQGVLLATVRAGVRKVFEVYDRLICAGIGSQADLEAVRLRAIDFAHTEGFVRSEDDVTVQRVVGFALSPTLKRAFADPMTAPFVARTVFAEMGDSQERDSFYVLNFDGEYTPYSGSVIIAGSRAGEEAGRIFLAESEVADSPDQAARTALLAWAAARLAQEDSDKSSPTREDSAARLRSELENATPEVGWLERDTPRQSKFSLWSRERIEQALGDLK